MGIEKQYRETSEKLNTYGNPIALMLEKNQKEAFNITDKKKKEKLDKFFNDIQDRKK